MYNFVNGLDFLFRARLSSLSVRHQAWYLREGRLGGKRLDRCRDSLLLNFVIIWPLPMLGRGCLSGAAPLYTSHIH
jgi:hypothetical protein